jgi:hypothetical protein
LWHTAAAAAAAVAALLLQQWCYRQGSRCVLYIWLISVPQ